MTQNQHKQLINAAIRAWLAVGSPIRAINELADEMGISLSEAEQCQLLLDAIDAR